VVQGEERLPSHGRQLKEVPTQQDVNPPERLVRTGREKARSRSSIKERVLMSIIDFSSMIRNLQSWKRACKDWSVATDRSDFFPLIGRRKRLCKVFPTILKAAIPVGAARKTGFCFPAS
jgi:hypothetical protein